MISVACRMPRCCCLSWQEPATRVDALIASHNAAALRLRPGLRATGGHTGTESRRMVSVDSVTYVNDVHYWQMFTNNVRCRIMNADPRGTQIIDAALEVLHEETGLTLKKVHRARGRADSSPPDAVLTLQHNGDKEEFAVECRALLARHTLGAVLQNLRRHSGHGMIVSRYIPPALGELIRENGAFFLDTAGNAYINLPNCFVHITCKKPPKASHERESRAFHAADLKVLFVLLCHPEAINGTYREVAALADVALGTVVKLFNKLAALGMLIRRGKERQLTDRKQLLDHWTLLYPTTLRPKLFIGRYRMPANDWWKSTDIRPEEARWGGEPAGALLTDYLKPAGATVYLRGKEAKFIAAHRLREAHDGEVELMRAFWSDSLDPADVPTTPPLLVYADLRATGNARNIETAELVYEQKLAGLIR